MKGQYRVIFEIMLFAIGVSIASFVMVNFQNLKDKTDELSIKDQMNTVLNSVINGVIQASTEKNSMVRVEIPPTISGRSYKIFTDNKEYITIIDIADSSIRTTRKVFNLDKPNDRIKGEVNSAGGQVLITYDGNEIKLTRD
jgi:hypothetical protein